jgi:hypothetical protein
VCPRSRHCDKGHGVDICRRGRRFGLIGGVSSDYRFSPPLVVRAMGLFLVLVGALVVVLVVLVVAFSLPVLVLTVGLVLAVLGVLATAAVLHMRAPVVRLSETGYRIRFVRGAGVPQAPWKDVEDAVATTVAGQRCVVLRLRDGRTTTVPVDVLAGDRDDFVRDLQRHLTHGHGYRPLR